MTVGGENAAELFFTPAIDQGTPALFLRQIAASDPAALHAIIPDQVDFYLPINDPHLPLNRRLRSLPPYCSKLNSVEWLDRLIKAQVRHRLFSTPARLEHHIEAAAKDNPQPAKVAANIHDWLLQEVAASVPTSNLKVSGD